MSARRDQPIRLADSERFLSKEACEALVRRIQGFAQGGGETEVEISSWWDGELRWARNRVSLGSDRRDIQINVARTLPTAGTGRVTTNQVDDASLTAAVRAAERAAQRLAHEFPGFVASPPTFEYPKPAIWSDATYNFAAEARARIVPTLVEPAEAAGMLSAGYLELRAQSVARQIPERPILYAQQTLARCSLTTRDPQGTGSGWAGLSSYDWATIDVQALAKRALEKCVASRNPVNLEPGRYTVILEPQAVHDLVSWVVMYLEQGFLGMPFGGGRAVAEDGMTPFAAGFDSALQLGRTKLGLKVVDERVTISHDPMDSALGVAPWYVAPISDYPEPVLPVTWINRGVLTALGHDRAYALSRLNENVGVVQRSAYRMSGGQTSMDEMIRTTTRGLLVTRLWNTNLLDDSHSLLLTGLTRDGLWLIEHGKITKAVKNFRFTESPMFVLNSLEQLGEPVPVFSPGAPVIVPPLKARDFSFTSLVDAV
jgi:predicted Zn-dependent protease